MSTLTPSDPVQPVAAPSISGPGVFVPAPYPFPEPPRDLISEDGIPLESDWHRIEMTLLIDVVTQHMGQRRDYFVGGNMFIYYSAIQARNLDYRGPDFFFVSGVPLDKPRPYWAIWDEGGRYPDLIIELASPSTIKEDRTTKKDIYEKTFRTREYYIYEPDSGELEAYHLTEELLYERVKPNEQGRVFSNVLKLWLGPWQGSYQEKVYRYLRWFDAEGNLAPTVGEAAKQLASQAEQRANAAEAELARLRSLLAAKEQGNAGQ